MGTILLDTPAKVLITLAKVLNTPPKFGIGWHKRLKLGVTLSAK